jgi:hypothetical protein
MEKDSKEFRKVIGLLLNTGNVSFNVFDGTIRKGGYLVPIEYFFEDLIDVVTFEDFFTEIENDVADIRDGYAGDYDFNRALYVDINAQDSHYEATLDLWFPDLPTAMVVADALEVEYEDIYDVDAECYLEADEE